MSQILEVLNFSELVATPFQGNINAICWNRKLSGDFAEIVRKVKRTGNITVLNKDQLLELDLSSAGNRARNIILEDLKVLKQNGASPVLNLIESYERDDSFFPTDVYSFHVDRSPVPTNTFLCTYYGATSEILPNENARQKVLNPKTRAELLKLYDGNEEGFNDFLEEYFFDLHYEALVDAKPIALGIGQLWRLAVDHPASEVLPCIHRAPVENDGQARLLLIC